VTARRAPRRASGQRGQTLFELIAVVTILGVVLTMVYEGIDSAGKAIGGTEKRLANLDEARILMAVSTKDVRTATRLQAGTSPFTVADKRELVFYANLNNNGSSGSVVDNGPRRVRIYVDSASQLIEEVVKPDASSVPPAYTYNGAPTRRFVGRYVANTASQPIFRYFDANGAELIPAPLSASNRLAVNSVQITLAIRRSTTFPIANTTLVNTVRLPNIDYQETLGG
jgi:prepilin-type N-terminal cleavage/methylation domain-containing protein